MIQTRQRHRQQPHTVASKDGEGLCQAPHRLRHGEAPQRGPGAGARLRDGQEPRAECPSPTASYSLATPCGGEVLHFMF